MSEFFNNDYMPHGHCYMWQPGILWSNVISDLVIATSYFSIAFALFIYSNKRKTQKFRSIIILFAIFILSCGVTHLFAIYTIWNGSYGVQGILKAITAVASASTMIVLLLNLDKIIAIPTPAELKKAENEAAREKFKRIKLELESRANAIFKFALELFPTGIILVDSKQNILLANNLIKRVFGYSQESLIGQSINTLIEQDMVENHRVLVAEYMKNPKSKEMHSGRLVWGRTKGGESVPVDVTLSVHEFENEKYTFASVVSVNDVGVQKKRFLETSRRLQRAVDATDVGIWEWNLINDKVWFSPKLIKLLSSAKEQDQFTVDDWREHIHPDDYEYVSQVLNDHLEQKCDYEVLYRGKNRSGEYQWLRSKGDTVFDDNGKPILMSGTLTNVDSLHRLQVELEKKNTFLDGVLSQSSATVLIVDVDNRTLEYSNDRLTEMFGYLDTELNNMLSSAEILTIIHPDDMSSFNQFYHSVLSPSEVSSSDTDIEVRLRNKNGLFVWCILNAEIHASERLSQTKQVLLSIVDISEIKEREENIKVLAKDFLDTFEQAAVGISHIDLDGKWIRVNQKLCDTLGYSRSELLSTQFTDICHPNDIETSRNEFNKLIKRQKDTFVLENRFIKKLGTVVWTRLTVSIVEGAVPDNRYFIAVLEDINDQKELEADLMRSNEELEQFAYVASHDLKEPLRTLKTYTSYLINDIETNKKDRVLEDKAFIDSAARRMTTLIDDLLSFSKLGNTVINIENTELTTVIKQVLNDLAVVIDEKAARIISSEKLPLVHCDPVLMRIAIQNLIQNAIKFVAPETIPEIKIEAIVKNSKVHLSISDNGIGIPEENQEQIFGVFKKLHTAEQYPGTGIGLAMVKKIVERLKCEITVESEVGRGTKFVLILPKGKRE